MSEQTNHTGKVEMQGHNPGIINWVGTMHSRNLTFYKMNGQYFVRSKSSLTRKRVKRAACFKKTREFAAKLGRASSIASSVYKQLPEGWKLHSLYRKLTGAGFQLLKAADHTDEDIINHLWQCLRALGYKTEIDYDEIAPSTTTLQEPVKKKKSTVRKKRVQHTILRIRFRQNLDKSQKMPDNLNLTHQLYLTPYHAWRQIAMVLSG